MKKVSFTWQTPVLCVTDLPASLIHYRDVLGFEIAWSWGNESFENVQKPTFACVCRGEISIFLCEQGQGQPGSWLCINVANKQDLEALFKEYQTSGADIAEPPTDCSWGMREMIVRDPDGNVFRMGCEIESCEP